MNHELISWYHEPKICKNFIFHESLFPKYDNCKILRLSRDRSKKKIPSDVLVCFKLRRYTLTWKIIKTLYVQILWAWRKLEFYTRVHKKIYFCCSLNYKIRDIYDHIAIVLALRTQHRTLLSIFFTKQYFFLIPILLGYRLCRRVVWIQLCQFECPSNRL